MRVRDLAVLAPLLNRKAAMSYLLFADYDMMQHIYGLSLDLAHK